VVYRFSAITTEISMAFFTNGKANPQIYLELQGSQKSQNSIKKEMMLKDSFHMLITSKYTTK
jgi:hypothetical protein